jgi:hypothetical protein
MALDTAAITAGIAAIQVLKYGGSAGEYITMKDVSALDPHVEQRELPLAMPMPGEWKGGAQGAPVEETTFGTASTRFWMVHQTLKYIFFQSTVGAERDINDFYLAASKNADLLWEALVELDVSGVDVEAVNITPIGVITDPMGDEFIGCFIEVTVREFVNP